MAILDVLSNQLGSLIQNLIKGNTRKAVHLARRAIRKDAEAPVSLISQNLIENLAQEQALKSFLLNLPSIFPGIGTLISFWLSGAENLLILDQSVILAMALRAIAQAGADDSDAFKQEYVLGIIAEVYQLTQAEDSPSTQSITRRYVTKELPQRYASVGLNSLLKRMFPYRSRIRLIPFFGVAYATIEAYSVINKVGQTSIKYIREHKQDS